MQSCFWEFAEAPLSAGSIFPLFSSTGYFSFPDLHFSCRMLEQEGACDIALLICKSQAVARECEVEEDIACEM